MIFSTVKPKKGSSLYDNQYRSPAHYNKFLGV
jgi:hypothetical protein